MVQVARYPSMIEGIANWRDMRDKNSSSCQVETYFRRDAVTGKKEWLAYPGWLDDLPFLEIATREEVAKWKRQASY